LQIEQHAGKDFIQAWSFFPSDGAEETGLDIIHVVPGCPQALGLIDIKDSFDPVRQLLNAEAGQGFGKMFEEIKTERRTYRPEDTELGDDSFFNQRLVTGQMIKDFIPLPVVQPVNRDDLLQSFR